jgi:hypothetical protein
MQRIQQRAVQDAYVAQRQGFCGGWHQVEGVGVTLRIKGWEQFQHFKDRRPPWIKLYRDLLDDIQWHELPAQSAKILVMLWLIASENDGYLPDAKTLCFRLRCTEKVLIQSVSELSHWLNTEISHRYQSDPLERETEERQRKETERETESSSAPLRVTLPAIVSLPLNDKTEFDATQDHVDEWATAYPAVNVVQKLREMRAWCLSNPTNRKTRRGIESFVNRWLAKEQDKSGKTGKPVETFAERDDRNAKERYERLTGRKHPDLLPQHLNIIEAEPIVRIAA